MNSDKKTPRGHRVWILIVILLLATGGILLLQLQPDLERNFKSWLTAAIVALAAILSLLWLVLLSRARWSIRLLTVALVAVGIWVFPKLVKVDGAADGRGLPHLVWRWSTPRKRVPVLPEAATVAVAGNRAATPADMTDVPQFFGPAREGVIHGAHLEPDWTTHAPKQLWRQPCGPAWSAFAVVNGRAFTQEQQGEDELVTSYEVLTGRRIWAHTNHVRFFQWQGGEGPRATPTVNQGQVFAYGATGILDCLDAETGQKVWSRDVLGENHLSNLTWGVSCSPLVYDDFVVVSGGGNNGPTILAYQRKTGEPLWHSGTDKASYTSPVLATLAGKKVVISANAASLTAHDATTGKLLLDQPWSTDKWPKASQPVVLDEDRVFLSAGYGVGCVMYKVKAKEDGMLAATELWKNLRMKAQFNSISVRAGYLYGLDDGLLACVDIATGERKWKDGHYGSGQTLLVDDLMIVQTEPGAVVLAAAKPEAFVELGSIPALSVKTWNHPTLAGRYLLVRNSEEMACYELAVSKSVAPEASVKVAQVP